MQKLVYLLLGSNLGDRRGNLDAASAQLEQEGVHVLRASSIFETEPQGLRDQDWFLNQVLEVETELFPRALLGRVKKIERAMGRVKTLRNGPRVIDIDILLYASAVMATKSLEIPHPRMGGRRFVLEPLAELAPELVHPVTKRTVREMLKAVTGQDVRRVERS